MGGHLFLLFDWFLREGLYSRYYYSFAVFLAGLLGEEMPVDRVTRLMLLDKNLVNVDLIPYHSERTSLHIETKKQEELVEPFVTTLRDLVQNMCKPKLVFFNGGRYTFERPLCMLGFTEKEGKNIRTSKGKEFTAHIGGLGTRAVWFDKFMSGAAVAATNCELFRAGQTLRECLML